MAGSVVNYEIDDKETQMEHRSNDRESIKLQSNNQKHINPTILESNNETKPTESIKRDSIQETSISTESNKLESKKPNDTKNKDNIKLDSNGDEIIWELKKERNTINFIWSWAIICGFFLFFSWCIYLMVPLFLNSFKYFFIIVMLVILQIYILYFKFYKTFNVKRLYATKNNLILQRYIGKDIIFPLGEFFVKDIATGYGIHIFGLYSEIQIVNFSNGLSYSFITAMNADKNTNLAQLKGIIESKTERCLIGLDKQKYEFHKKVGNFLKCLKPNFNKIDKLREQKANNG